MNRTNQQNKAFRLYIKQLSEIMIEAGFDVRKKLKPGASIDPTPEVILLTMVRPVMYAMFDIEWKNPDRPSTTELDTKQIGELYETMNRFTGDRFGISMDFPSLESLMNRWDNE